MKKIFLIASMLLSLASMHAQEVSGLYQELPNPVATDASKWVRVTNPIVAWGIASFGNSSEYHESYWMDG